MGFLYFTANIYKCILGSLKLRIHASMPHHRVIINDMHSGELNIKLRIHGQKLIKYKIIWIQNITSIGVEILF